MTQLDFNFQETNGRGNNSQKTDENIIELEGRGSRPEIKAKDRARQPDRNNMPGVDLS